jgi:hypothetical protein
MSSGVHRLAAAERKGTTEPTNQDLKENGVASKKEQGEKYGKEKK